VELVDAAQDCVLVVAAVCVPVVEDVLLHDEAVELLVLVGVLVVAQHAVAQAPEGHASLHAVSLRPQPVSLRLYVSAAQPHVAGESELFDVLVYLPESVGVVHPGQVPPDLLAQRAPLRPVPPDLVQEGEAPPVQLHEGGAALSPGQLRSFHWTENLMMTELARQSKSSRSQAAGTGLGGLALGVRH